MATFTVEILNGKLYFLCSMGLILRHLLTTILDTKLKRFHGGFFELDMLEIFIRSFLLKSIIRTWSRIEWILQVLKKWKKESPKDSNHLKKLLHITRDTKRGILKREGEMKIEKYKKFNNVITTITFKNF